MATNSVVPEILKPDLWWYSAAVYGIVTNPTTGTDVARILRYDCVKC